MGTYSGSLSKLESLSMNSQVGAIDLDLLLVFLAFFRAMVQLEGELQPIPTTNALEKILEQKNEPKQKKNKRKFRQWF